MRSAFVVVLASVSILASCGSSSTKGAPTATGTAPSTTASPSPLTTAAPAAATTAPTATTAASATAGNYASVVCDAIKAVEAALAGGDATLSTGEASFFSARFVIEMTNRLPADKLKEAMDDAAVQKLCPAEYAKILKQMNLPTLSSV
jgi:hypothetical protein